MASCGNVQVRALDGGRCTRVATRGQDSHTVLTLTLLSEWVFLAVSGRLRLRVATFGGFAQVQRSAAAVEVNSLWVCRRLASSCCVAGLRAEPRGRRRRARFRRRRTGCGPLRSPCAHTSRDLGARWSTRGACRQAYRTGSRQAVGSRAHLLKNADGRRRWRGRAGHRPVRMRNGGRGGGRGSGGRRLQRAAAPGYGVGDWAGQTCNQQAGVSYTDINSRASRLLCADESDALAKASSQPARLCEAQRSGAAAATGGSGEWMAMEGGPARLDWRRW